MFEEAGSAVRCAEGGVGLGERCVHVGTEVGSDALMLERGFQALDRVEMMAAVSGGEPEPNRRPTRRDAIACALCFGENFLELLLCSGRVRLEAELELCVRELELPGVDLADLTAGLEVLDGDGQFLRELAERLDRWRTCARFDARDVRIRHSWG